MLTEQQLEMRAQGIGGTDAAAVANMHPYKTGMDVWLEKTGQVEQEDISGLDRIRFGNLLEPVIAEEYMHRTGRKLRRVNRTLMHKQLPFVRANIDRDIVGMDGGLEIKTADAFFKFQPEQWGEQGTDEVPMQYHFQCNHYMAVTGANWWDLAVLMGGNEFRIYTIQRDDELISDLLDIERDFWVNHVEKLVPPPLNFRHERTLDTLKNLYPGTNGETIFLDADAFAWHQKMQDAKAQMAELKKVCDEAKARILAQMGEAAIGQFIEGGCYTRKEVTRKSYTVAESSYIDFRFSKKGK